MGDNRVFNKSRWPAKFAAISHEQAAYFSLEITRFKKSIVICVLFKHFNFCSRMLEMHSKRPRL